MVFELFIPYIQGASTDINDNMNGYYKTEQDYADALIDEDTSNGTLVYNTMTRGGFGDTVYYDRFGREIRDIEDRIAFAKAECKLLTPDGCYSENVDTMIDKFVSQREFIMTVHLDTKEMSPEFEEEIREWSKETINIYLASREIMSKGGTKHDSELFVEKNIPRRELRLSFLNKSGKRLNFVLKECEIEHKVAKNRYLIYVKRMDMLK